jgi:hypothetical protein
MAKSKDCYNCNKPLTESEIKRSEEEADEWHRTHSLWPSELYNVAYECDQCKIQSLKSELQQHKQRTTAGIAYDRLSSGRGCFGVLLVLVFGVVVAAVFS